MRDKKLQVFVSSTYEDLREERQAAVEAILSAGHIPAGMELFAAGDESQMTVIERWIDESDIFLLILGGRYGSIEKRSGKSYTHLEFEYALSKGKPLFSVVISEKAQKNKASIYGSLMSEIDTIHKYEQFKDLVEEKLVKFWDDMKDIKLAIHETISDMMHRKELVGWVRADSVGNTVLMGDELARLTKENSELRVKLNKVLVEEVKYGGLNFDEMRDLLEKESFKITDGDSNLFLEMFEIGKRIAKNPRIHADNIMLPRQLAANKILKIERIKGTPSFEVSFTEDGHNFYLRAKLLGYDVPPPA
jgi:hypothetical protein